MVRIPKALRQSAKDRSRDSNLNESDCQFERPQSERALEHFERSPVLSSNYLDHEFLAQLSQRTQRPWKVSTRHVLSNIRHR